MKFKLAATVFVAGVTFFIALSQSKNSPFAPAEDFPRGALVYAQIADLPRLIKLWNESKFKGKYLKSENYESFQKSHLGLKLARRWTEFNEAAGFSVELETLSGLTNSKGAIALYDIGKLDFVFIAPASKEIYAATAFVRQQDKFAQETLEDGTIVYRVKVEADRGRQKQELIFTHTGGRFVLATSEKLLYQTIKNINDRTSKNSLADDPLFKSLSETFDAHAATVWVNQTALNDDYYFKRYYLMSEVEELKNIRAGIFDFSVNKEDGKLIERRKFLLAQSVKKPDISTSQAQESLPFLPANIPFYRLQSADMQSLNGSVLATMFEQQKTFTKTATRRHYYSFSDYEDSETQNYSALSADFDETIDESQNNDSSATVEIPEVDFAQSLQKAEPKTILTFAEPKIMPAPLFADFRRAAILTLNKPSAFDRDSFEQTIAKRFSSMVAVSASGTEFNWESKNESGSSWRELNLPMTGWKAAYTIKDNVLILGNDTEFLREIMASQSNIKTPSSSFAELTVVNFSQRDAAFDQIFKRLAGKNNTDSFFTGNVSSLLDSADALKTIEIKRNYEQSFLMEEITVDFK